jgi:hypothetical protein
VDTDEEPRQLTEVRGRIKVTPVGCVFEDGPERRLQVC